MKKGLIAGLVLLNGMLMFGQAGNTAYIKELSGTVELKAPGAAWKTAVRGDRIVKDTIISTGFRSTALLSLGNSTLTVRPLTRLGIEELGESQGREQVALNLQTGRVRASVTPPAGGRTDFTVRSPSATASVRGTVFDLDTQNLRVREGTVRFEGAAAGGRPVLVNSGQSTWVDSGTGAALNPLTAMETSRALPALPGSDSVPAVDGGGARPDNPQGTLSIVVSLDSR